jgi:hypothetical protein
MGVRGVPEEDDDDDDDEDDDDDDSAGELSPLAPDARNSVCGVAGEALTGVTGLVKADTTSSLSPPAVEGGPSPALSEEKAGPNEQQIIKTCKIIPTTKMFP